MNAKESQIFARNHMREHWAKLSQARACPVCHEAPIAYTFDDISIKPQEISRISSRRDAQIDLGSQISPKVRLKLPVVASYMDTVCEAKMAIAIAQLGGLGIIHRWMTIEEQVSQVRRVKRAENEIIEDPYTLRPSSTVAEIRRAMAEYGVGGLLITDERGKLLGIVTTRDIDFKNKEEDLSMPATAVMTPLEKLIVASKGVTLHEAKKLLDEHKLEKIPVVDNDGVVCGLISKKDIKKMRNRLAARDDEGHLLVAASVGLRGADLFERTGALLEAGADLIVLAIANGYLESAINATRRLRKKFPDVDLAVGDVTEYAGTKRLFAAGADTVLVGIGPGSSCETRYIAGVGVPQFTALRWAASAARAESRYIICDGGVHEPHHFGKALFAGASAVILGGALAGTDEAPGEVVDIGGRKMKQHRGLASEDARAKLERILGASPKKENDHALQEAARFGGEDLYGEVYMHVAGEGVEQGFFPYTGATKEAIKRLTGGLRSLMTYLGVNNLEGLWDICDMGLYISQTAYGAAEGKPHHMSVFRD